MVPARARNPRDPRGVGLQVEPEAAVSDPNAGHVCCDQEGAEEGGGEGEATGGSREGLG